MYHNVCAIATPTVSILAPERGTIHLRTKNAVIDFGWTCLDLVWHVAELAQRPAVAYQDQPPSRLLGQCCGAATIVSEEDDSR
jgi:hypothetical protein